MKFTLLCPDLVDTTQGGIPTVTRQALRQIERIADERGIPIDFDIWALHDKPCSEVDVARASGLRRPPLRFRGFGGARLSMLAAAAAERGEHDFVFTTHIGVGPVGRLLRGARGKLVQFIHGVECWRKLSLPQRAGLEATDGILSNSRFTLNRFFEFNPEWKRIPGTVCWLGLNRDLDSNPTEGIAPADSVPSVLIVGRMTGSERYKGHEELISVWTDVRRFLPTARLDIVGGGDARADIEARAERLGHIRSGAIRFLGRVPYGELRECYRRTDVFAMPSCGEGFGLVYLEAMAEEKPCIASTNDAACEVVIGGETGLLVRYGDRPGLARVVVELLDDVDKRRRLGKLGRQRLLQHFTEEHFGGRLWNALSAFAPDLRPAG
ncbi:MAG: glycosyltransferase family 4 protein [Polyangiaceae bacterium]|nr:glycosyltransferase family 4 protein [Polyangiaceae bacterium]